MTIRLETSDDWWTEFSAIKSDIRIWGPKDKSVSDILANDVSRQLLGPKRVDILQTFEHHTIWSMIDELERVRSKDLYTILHSIWEDAPDAPYIHTWPSWGRFCDLLSEGPHCLGLGPED